MKRPSLAFSHSLRRRTANPALLSISQCPVLGTSRASPPPQEDGREPSAGRVEKKESLSSQTSSSLLHSAGMMPVLDRPPRRQRLSRPPISLSLFLSLCLAYPYPDSCASLPGFCQGSANGMPDELGPATACSFVCVRVCMQYYCNVEQTNMWT
ncbi:hypothetical protein GGI42DRAFT_103746 [Trichoderma sp. SZMC 28013]